MFILKRHIYKYNCINHYILGEKRSFVKIFYSMHACMHDINLVYMNILYELTFLATSSEQYKVILSMSKSCYMLRITLYCSDDVGKK